MLTKLWKDMLGDGGIRAGTPETIEEIINDFLVPNRIDLRRFVGNYLVLKKNGSKSPLGFFTGSSESGDEAGTPTPSIHEHENVLDRALGMPLWFFAAFPDVISWFNNLIKNNLSGDRDSMEKLFKFHQKDFNVPESVLNGENGMQIKYLKNLLESYKEITRKDFETQAPNVMDDLYVGSDLLNTFGFSDNFTLIATITSMLFAELKLNHRNRFPDQASLLAAAGFLDAQHYVLIEKSITLSELLEMAKEATKKDDPTVEFIVNLIERLLVCDNPDIPRDVIKNSCQEKRIDIERTIKQTINSYHSDPQVAANVQTFLKAEAFKEIREELGIKKKFFFF